MESVSSIIGTNLCSQIGIVVCDIEKAAAQYAHFFGVPIPEIRITGEFEDARTYYRGKPTRARTKQAFFDIGRDNQSIELLEPDFEPSTWREFLDKRGEGVHHICFPVEDMEQKITRCEAFGMKLVQRGKWDTGHYAYLDASDSLHTIIELVEDGIFDR